MKNIPKHLKVRLEAEKVMKTPTLKFKGVKAKVVKVADSKSELRNLQREVFNYEE